MRRCIPDTHDEIADRKQHPRTGNTRHAGLKSRIPVYHVRSSHATTPHSASIINRFLLKPMRGRAGLVDPGLLPVLVHCSTFDRYVRDLIRTAMCRSPSARIMTLAGENAGSDMTRSRVDQDVLVLCRPIMIDQVKAQAEKYRENTGRGQGHAEWRG
jgi:hypothetical protein